MKGCDLYWIPYSWNCTGEDPLSRMCLCLRPVYILVILFLDQNVIIVYFISIQILTTKLLIQEVSFSFFWTRQNEIYIDKPNKSLQHKLRQKRLQEYTYAENIKTFVTVKLHSYIMSKRSKNFEFLKQPVRDSNIDFNYFSDLSFSISSFFTFFQSSIRFS
jgi:hypothetical protein